MTAFCPVFLQEDEVIKWLAMVSWTGVFRQPFLCHESCTSQQSCTSSHYTSSLDCVHDDPSMFLHSGNTCSCDIWALVLDNLLETVFFPGACIRSFAVQAETSFAHVYPFATFQWLTSFCMIDSLRPHQGPSHSVPGTSCKSHHPRLWPSYPHRHGSPHRQDDGLLYRIFLHPGCSGRLQLPQSSSQAYESDQRSYRGCVHQ